MDQYVDIAPEQLNSVTLQNLVKEFVLREGTDYGAREQSLETKISQVIHALRHKQAFILFDLRSESFNIISSNERLQLQKKFSASPEGDHQCH